MSSERSDDFFEKVEVGQNIPPLTKRAVTKELFMTWGRVGGELHPIFGGSHLEEVDSQAAGQAEVKGWLFGGQLSVRMVRPISPDELITCQGRVAHKIENQSQRCLVCEVWIEKETGERAVAGEATIRF